MSYDGLLACFVAQNHRLIIRELAAGALKRLTCPTHPEAGRGTSLQRETVNKATDGDEVLHSAHRASNQCHMLPRSIIGSAKKLRFKL